MILFVKKLQNKKILIIFAFFLFFVLGAHFHKQHLWPFGQGYYLALKDFKKSFLNNKNKTNLVEQKDSVNLKNEEEIVKKEEEVDRSNIYRTTSHLINVQKIIDFDFDHFALFQEQDNEIEIIAIKGNDSIMENLQPLNIYKAKLNLSSGSFEKKLILQVQNNLRATDVLVTDNKRIFISYLSVLDDKNGAQKVIELFINDNKYSFTEIFKTNTYSITGAWVSGGKMIQMNENEILMGMGDNSRWGYEDNNYAEINTDFGKSFLININDKTSIRYTKGHRNPQGLVKSDKFIIETEHGPEGGDEINLIEPNNDYGWPYVSYGAKYYDQYPETPHDTLFGSHEGYTKPIYAFIPSIGIKAIEQIPNSQDEFPNWRNDFLICSLKGIFRTKIIFDDYPRVVFTSKLEDKSTFKEPLKKVEGCRDLQITSSGIVLTNNGNLITRKKRENL